MKDVDQLIGGLLRAGVMLAAVVVIAGWPLLLATRGHVPVDFAVFRGEPGALHTLRGIVRAAIARDGAALVQLGLVLLIATPIARVALTLVTFIAQRDRTYVVLSGVVLVLLLWGLL